MQVEQSHVTDVPGVAMETSVDRDVRRVCAKLGVSESVYRFRRDRFDQYQATMFQVGGASGVNPGT